MIKDLDKKHGVPCEGGVEPLNENSVLEYVKAIESGWVVAEDYKSISRNLKFQDYSKTLLFANAVAWIAEREGHHPDLLIQHRRCTVTYTTHAIDGLSENDFICAKKVDNLVV